MANKRPGLSISWRSGLCRFLVTALVFGVLDRVSAKIHAQDTPDYFKKNCMSCHTIGGGSLIGPDLKDVSKRKDRDWLAKFIMDPRGVIESGDSYAKKIFEEARRVPMPTPPGITRERADKLLVLIEAESKLEESQFKGLQISSAPFTEVDRENGRNIFLGLQSLDAGGASCISCHSMHDVPALGGGRLGPDLTKVFERLNGRPSLSAWLNDPPTETMQPIFKQHKLTADEIHSLVAYFESSAPEEPSRASTSRVAFLLMGLAGATVWIFLFDFIWKKRFRAVRRPLVESDSQEGSS